MMATKDSTDGGARSSDDQPILHRYQHILAVAAVVLGIGLGFWVGQRENRSYVKMTLAASTVIKPSSDLLELRVPSAGLDHSIESVRIITVKLENTGRKGIDGYEFPDNDARKPRVLLNFEAEARILAADVQSLDHSTQLRPLETDNPNEVAYAIDLLNVGGIAQLNLVVEGDVAHGAEIVVAGKDIHGDFNLPDAKVSPVGILAFGCGLSAVIYLTAIGLMQFPLSRRRELWLERKAITSVLYIILWCSGIAVAVTMGFNF